MSKAKPDNAEAIEKLLRDVDAAFGIANVKLREAQLLIAADKYGGEHVEPIHDAIVLTKHARNVTWREMVSWGSFAVARADRL